MKEETIDTIVKVYATLQKKDWIDFIELNPFLNYLDNDTLTSILKQLNDEINKNI